MLRHLSFIEFLRRKLRMSCNWRTEILLCPTFLRKDTYLLCLALYLLQNRLCAIPKPAAPKTGFAPMLNQPLQNRLCVCSKAGFVPMLNLPLLNRLCAYAKPTAPKLALCLLQNRLCAYAKPAAPKPALRLCWTNRYKTGFVPAPKPALCHP